MTERRLLIATRSAHKLAELRGLLELQRTRLVTLDDLGIGGDVVEDGATFADNAIIKARWGAEQSGVATLADDSGIEVDALDGRPGVRTRRYAGEDATDDDNNTRLLEELLERGAFDPLARAAHYVCVLAFIDPELPASGPGGSDSPLLSEGEFRGRIASAPRGQGGFGYDPVFEPDDEPAGGRTVGQMPQAEKDRRSHRAAASRAMGERLRRLGY
ncbi:MAG TPA: non-canonical purine NTP pyrophosphatase [Candidatus Limnocylindrales bacterium]|jgi:XTP/dITP diphosphohydrolase